MALLTRSGERRRGALLTPASLVVILFLVVALVLSFQRSSMTVAGSGSSSTSGAAVTDASSSSGSMAAGTTPPGTSKTAAQIPDYEDIPDIGIKMNLPTWAICPRPPCKFASMVDGAQNMSIPWSSQFGEDVWLQKKLFYNKVKGFYVEMGAMNGVDISNTRWLYQAADWKGLLIEACPAMANDLIQNRKDAISVHAAVCGEFRTVHWHSAGNVGGIFEFMAEGFKEIFHKDLKVETLPEVPCVPFQFLIDMFSIGEIDFWSLDVEGAELEVLKTVDFNRLKVKVIMIELDNHNPDKDKAVIRLLMDVGYDVLKKTDDMNHELKHYNTIFVHKSAWPDMAHAPDVDGPVIEGDPLNAPVV